MDEKKAPVTTPRANNQRHEVNQNPDQLDRVFDAFFDEPRTMKEADKVTGIMRENICWYCRTLRKQNSLFPIGKRLCRVTKHRATVYTTDLAKALNSPQLKLSML